MVGGYIIIDLAKSANELVSKLSMNNHNKAIMVKNAKLGETTETAFGTYTRTGSTWELIIPYVSAGKVYISAYTITPEGVTNKQINIVEG